MGEIAKSMIGAGERAILFSSRNVTVLRGIVGGGRVSKSVTGGSAFFFVFFAVLRLLALALWAAG